MRMTVGALFVVVSACGPGQEQQRTETTTPDERRGPDEMLACSTGLDPAPHLPKLQPWLPQGSTAEAILETRPLVDDLSGDGLDDLVFYIRATPDRYIGIVGCQDAIVTGLGVYRMEGLDGVVTLDKVDAIGTPPGEVLVKVELRQPPAIYERWRYLRFDGASLNQVFAITKKNVPPVGNATQAEINFIDRDRDGVNEVVAMEETVDGDGARARNTDPSAPLPRVLGSRQVRFRFDQARGTYVQEEVLGGRGVVSRADITAEPTFEEIPVSGLRDAGPRDAAATAPDAGAH